MKRYYIVRIRERVEDFVKNSKVAVGWSETDFTKYINDPEGLKSAVNNKYYSKDGIAPTTRGRKLNEVKRFINIEENDIILVPGYRCFYIGSATNQFSYDKVNYKDDLANQLQVDFKKDENNEPMSFARDGKNTALATKLGVRGFTVLEITNSAIIKSIEELLESDTDMSEADKVIKKENQGLAEFKKSLKDVLPQYESLSLNAKGRGFEDLIKELMECDGYKAEILSNRIGGSGYADADILAIKESGLTDEFTSAIYIQVKHHHGESDDGIDQIVEFKRLIEESNQEFQSREGNEITLSPENIKYVLLSSGFFTTYVKNKAEINGIILIDGDQLAEILFNKIDDISPDIRYKLGFVKKYEYFTK